MHKVYELFITHKPSDNKCVAFFLHTNQFSNSLNANWLSFNSIQFNSIQFNSILTLSGVSADPTGLGLSPTILSPTSDANRKF